MFVIFSLLICTLNTSFFFNFSRVYTFTKNILFLILEIMNLHRSIYISPRDGVGFVFFFRLCYLTKKGCLNRRSEYHKTPRLTEIIRKKRNVLGNAYQSIMEILQFSNVMYICQ